MQQRIRPVQPKTQTAGVRVADATSLNPDPTKNTQTCTKPCSESCKLHKSTTTVGRQGLNASERPNSHTHLLPALPSCQQLLRPAAACCPGALTGHPTAGAFTCLVDRPLLLLTLAGWAKPCCLCFAAGRGPKPLCRKTKPRAALHASSLTGTPLTGRSRGPQFVFAEVPAPESLGLVGGGRRLWNSSTSS